MKFAWYAIGLALAGTVAVSAGCGDDEGGSGGSGAATSSSSSSGMGGGSTTSSSTGSSMSGSSSSSSSSGSGGYSVCSDCTSNTSGALVKECKTQADACSADADCQKLANCWFDNATTDKAGGCATLKCQMDLGTPQAAITKFKAMDQCVTCMTCKALCEPGSTEYCMVVNSGAPMCP